MKAAIYARLSVTTDESVSIERQKQSARDYARARGWEVVATYVDDGVSATKNRPEQRAGWHALMTGPEPFDVVIIWKVDRLARHVLDFLTATDALRTRGADLVAVADPIDLTTAQGKAFATMLAVFGEMEAAATGARVREARNYILTHGRWAGGTVLYGYRQRPNPDGHGWVLEQDPDRIGYVQEMVRRTRAGRPLNSTVSWLADSGAPTARGGDWTYSTVDHIVRHPLLAGMIPHNPSSTRSTGERPHTRGDGVAYGPDGLPLVYPDLAVMSVAEWRDMQKQLAPSTGRRKPWASRAHTSGVLSGLVWCGEHDEPLRMYRGRIGPAGAGRPCYKCQSCYQTISNFEPLVIADWLAAVGDESRFNPITVEETGGAEVVARATERLTQLTDEYVQTDDPGREATLEAEISRLKAVRREARALPTHTVTVPEDDGVQRTYAEAYAAADDDYERNRMIGQTLDRIVVRRGGRGARSDAAKRARLTWEWLPGFPPGPQTYEEALKSLILPEEMAELERADDANRAADETRADIEAQEVQQSAD